MIELITQTYQQTVKEAPVPDELKQSLKFNERVPGFFSNLKKELTLAKATREEVIEATRDLTLIFLNNVDRAAKERMMTDAEKSRILTEQHKVNVLRESAESGIIDEEVISVLSEEKE